MSHDGHVSGFHECFEESSLWILLQKRHSRWFVALLEQAFSVVVRHAFMVPNIVSAPQRGQARVEHGFFESQGLPNDLAAIYDWDSLLDPIAGLEDGGTLAWELDACDLPAPTPASTDQRETAAQCILAGSQDDRPLLTSSPKASAVVPDGIKKESNRLAQRKSRQKKQVFSLNDNIAAIKLPCPTTCNLSWFLTPG